VIFDLIAISLGWFTLNLISTAVAYHQGVRDGERIARRHFRLGRAGTDREER
jgi:hypothetical protein